MNRVIPPILFLVLLAAQAALAVFHSDDFVMRAGRAMPWDIPLALGVVVLVWARLQFRAQEAEIHTFRQPRTLVTGGLFRFSRNPMYLGFLLLLIAAAFFVNHWCALIAPAIFFIAASFWYIPHEERTLRAVFGPQYEAYAGRVRRWL